MPISRLRFDPWLRAMALIAALLLSQATASAAEAVDPVIAEVKARDAELSAAHGRGDMATYLTGLSKHYVYTDVGGRRVTAEQLAKRRGNDQLRQVASEVLEEESLRVSDGVVLLSGLERASFTYFGGLPRQGSTRWTALWAREEDGQWRLVAETATPVTGDGGLPFTQVRLPEPAVRSRQGLWQLALPQPMQLQLTPEGGRLIGTLPGQSIRLTFVPASATRYYALERPFELRFDSKERQKLTLVTWGIETTARRVTPSH
ncbi:ketosteroid isomerase-like protein [Pelomonas saccharophila]|uniref:Ketosteroid isomerase-like protein n=1 Tax=Roseateles saccharophilus TaxID=304 RepID=A0ABU1YRE1_ROSSA|nr:nuclear transport factor 2 family protein [Roseateles saccharophilus]MDR7270771.1 ketosteroid isomerase-like protein [Roseateles saccharophilus]